MASNNEIHPCSNSNCRSSEQNPRRKLFKVQDAQELNDPEKVSSRWVKHLYGLVDELNYMETEMIGMKPNNAIVLDQAPLVKRESYPPEEALPEDGLYRYLLQPSEEQND